MEIIITNYFLLESLVPLYLVIKFQLVLEYPFLQLIYHHFVNFIISFHQMLHVFMN